MSPFPLKYNLHQLTLKLFFFNVGYYVRKYIYNYYSRKRYLEGVVIKNEVVRWESLPCNCFLLILVILVFNPLTCKSD